MTEKQASAIEPPPCTKCEEAHRALDTYGIARGALGHSVRYRIGLLADEMRPTPEASSEIREAALKEAINLLPGKPNEHDSAQFREGYYAGLEAYRQAIRTALAPSRQGAAK